MKTLFSIAFVALAAVAVSASGAHADDTAPGTCNAIVATAMDSAQACWNFACVRPGDDNVCGEFALAFSDFFSNSDCAMGFMDTLEGLTGSAAVQPDGSNNPMAVKHIGEVVCNAVADCGLCVLAAPVVGDCGGFCPLP